MKRLSKVKIYWSNNFAYAIGLIATDGNLSKDGRHINFTSKDIDLIFLFKKCLNLKNKIGLKARGGSKEKKYFQIQFGDKNFYDFLKSIGITPAKSKTIGKLLIPGVHFANFLRGCIDGDGNINISSHPESKNPQIRTRLFSASKKFLVWIKKEIKKMLHIKNGWIDYYAGVYVLSYGKADSLILLKFIYNDKMNSYLERKYLIIKDFII